MPRHAETQHLLVCGTTGTGKSTLIEDVIAAVRSRGDRLVVCDPAGTFLSKFAQTGDILMSPFDTRSAGWTIFNEWRTDYDATRLARAIVPEGHGEVSAWNGYARVLLEAILRLLVRRGELSTESLLRLSTSAPSSELREMLAGTPAVALLEPDASKALASVRFILASHLAPHEYLRHGAFSLRRWVTEGSGSLFMTWRADMQAALAPLLSAWLGIVSNQALSLAPDPDRRLWLVVDELAALGPISALAEILTLGRKFGVCVIAGLQSTAQLDQLYGREAAITLRSCFRTLIVLGISRSDPDTSEFLSRALGERELIRVEESRGLGDHGHSSSSTARRSIERLVLPSEIAGLPDLEGYLALAGTSEILPLHLTPKVRARMVEPFEEHPS